jgi:translocation and assembly module TamB
MKLSRGFRRTLIVLALVAAGAGGLYAFLQSKPGADAVAALIESAASSDRLRLKIDGLEGALPGHPRAAKVTLSDSKGPWLVLHDVDADWTPLALVSGDIVAETISVAKVEWLRLPEGGNGGSSGDAIPSLKIGKLSIAEALIAPEVVGRGGTFKIDVAADTLSMTDRASLSLNVTELGGAVRVAVDAHYEPAKALLDLDAKIEDGPGGTLAALLELPPDAPLTVMIDSDGSLDDWRAELRTTGGNALSATGDATIKRQGAWRQLKLRVVSDVTSAGPEQLRPLYEGHGTVDILAAHSDQGAWRIDRLVAVTPAFTANARGVFDASARKAELIARLNVPEGKALAPLIGDGIDWRELALDAKTEGAWPNPTLAIEVRAADVAAEGIRASAFTGRLTAAPDRRWDEVGAHVAVAVRLDAGELGADDETLRRVLGTTATVSIQTMVIARERLSGIVGELKTETATLRFAGDADAHALNGVVSLDALDLARAGLKGDGLSLNATVEANLDSARWTAEGKGTATNFAPGGAIDALFAGKQNINFALEGIGPGRYRASSVAVQGERLTAIAGGEITPDALDVDADITIPNLGTVAPEHAGRAELQIKVGGKPDAPTFAGTASLSDGKLFGRAAKALLLGLGEPDDKGLSRLSLTGAYDGQPVQGSARVAWRGGGGAQVEDLDLTLATLKTKGAADIDAAGLIRGGLALDARDLSRFAPFIGESIAGALSGTLRFEAAGAQQTLLAALRGPRFAVADAAFAGIAVDGAIRDLFGEAAPNMRVRAAQADLGGFALQNLDAQARGTFAALDVAAKAVRAGTAIAARATAHFDEEPNVISIAALELARGDKSARLAEPVDIILAGGKVTIPKTRLLAGGGTATLSGEAGRKTDIAVEADALPLWVAAFATDPLPVLGTASGTARIRDGGAVGFDLKVQNLAPEANPRIVRNMTLTATGATGRAGVDFKLRLADGSRTAFDASGRVPFAETGALRIDAEGTADLALANVYLSVTGDRVRGALTTSARITGTRAAPRIQGTGRIANGFFRSAAAGFELRDIAAVFDGDERRIAVTSLTAKAANGGAVTGRGAVTLDPANGYPVELAINADGAQFVATTLTTVIADLDVRLTGGVTRQMAIAGTADVEQWDIRLPERLARPLTPIRVRHVNAPADIAPSLPQEEPEEQSSLPFTLDVAVRAPQRVTVRGQGVQAEFGGAVKVAGSVDSPSINGRFDLRRGSVELLGRRVELTRGEIAFKGGVVPAIDIAGEVRKSSVTAVIAVRGKADAPEIKLTSTPSLPQDEIMARVLFDKSTQQLSAFEAAQLAGAIGRWSGLATAPDILESLRETLGIDSLSAVTDAGGGTAVSAGSYIGSGVYVGFVQGTDAAAGRATVDIDLTDDVKLRGEAGPTGDTRIGVVAEWEY